jgi:DNA helicase-2/ATP-dependent DNA helicase PcrA
MWQDDKSAEAPGRLDNLKELVRSMERVRDLPASSNTSRWSWTWSSAEVDAVSIMTLHAAKGLEFDTVFLPGWEEGLFPHQRALDESGRSGLEEERRLAYVGITRAKRAKLWFVSNRRIHGLWQSTVPSRFLDELPVEHVEIAETVPSYGGYGGGRLRLRPYGASRFDQAEPFAVALLARLATRATKPQPRDSRELGHALRRRRRAHRLRRDGFRLWRRARLRGRVIEGELVAKSVSDTPRTSRSATASST